MSDVVRANPSAAMRGGEPGTFPLVRGFVGLRLQSQNIQGLTDGVIEDRPLWPMVYYCLRSGDPNAALHCLKKAGFVLIFGMPKGLCTTSISFKITQVPIVCMYGLHKRSI